MALVFWEGFLERVEEVPGLLALPGLEYGFFNFVDGLGGEATNAKQVVRADRLHSGDSEGDGL